MTTNITPDKARKLLDGTTPGPWQSRGDGPSSGKPYLRVCTCDDRTHVAESVSWDNAPLITAAPALAELVAGMHYEYAAQVERNGRKYIITDSDEGHWLCGDDHKVLQDWHPCYMEAEDYAYSWNRHEGKRDGTTAHVIRRLVTDPEVVE